MLTSTAALSLQAAGSTKSTIGHPVWWVPLCAQAHTPHNLDLLCSIQQHFMTMSSRMSCCCGHAFSTSAALKNHSKGCIRNKKHFSSILTRAQESYKSKRCCLNSEQDTIGDPESFGTAPQPLDTSMAEKLVLYEVRSKLKCRMLCQLIHLPIGNDGVAWGLGRSKSLSMPKGQCLTPVTSTHVMCLKAPKGV